MNSNKDPWIKINSETYLECIVGNVSGLIKLKELIQSAIDNKRADVTPHIKSDFKVVVCTEEEFEETESKPLPRWQNVLFYSVLVTWVGILPIVGIIMLVCMWFT